MKNFKGTKGKIKRATPVVVIMLAVLALAFIILWSKIKLGIGVICPLKYWFNWECPGCGVTRMCEAFLKGDIYQSFRYNPFIFATAPLMAIVFAWQFVEWVWRGHILKHLDKFLILYIILLVAFGLIRNTRVFAFLAPTIV